MTRRALLICGVLSSLLYLGIDLLTSARYEGYSRASHTISELSAIGSPTRRLAVPLFVAYGALVIAFGFGVLAAVRRKRSLRIAGGLLVGYGVVCLIGPFTPMHQREVLAAGGKTLTDTLHIVGAIVDVLFILLIIASAATAFGKRFRLYSIGTVLVVVAFGVLAGRDGPRLEANLPTPWVGVTERINIYACMLWMAVLAVATDLRNRHPRDSCTKKESSS